MDDPIDPLVDEERNGLPLKALAPGSKAVQLCLEEAGFLNGLEQLGFGIVAFDCATCICNFDGRIAVSIY